MEKEIILLLRLLLPFSSLGAKIDSEILKTRIGDITGVSSE